MDFSNIVSLAQVVAPKLGEALAPDNPLVPLAVNVIGAALGLDGPHTTASVTVGAAVNHTPDSLAKALIVAQDALAKILTPAGVGGNGVVPVAPLRPGLSPAGSTVTVLSEDPGKLADDRPTSIPGVAKPVKPVTSTGGEYLNVHIQDALHVLSMLGGVIAGTGLLNPDGPLAGVLTGRPVLGLAFAVASTVINHFLVKSSNDATDKLTAK